MKIRKIYENEIKINSILSEYFKFKKDFNLKKEEISKLLNEFKSLYDPKYWKLEYTPGFINDCYFSETEDKILFQTNNIYYTLNDEDFKNLVEFLEDPELYRNAKKFNL